MLLESEKSRVAVSKHLLSDYRRIVECLAKVTEVATLEHTKDYWCRDYMPLQKTKDCFLEFTYHPDYLRGKHEEYVTDATEVLMSICDSGKSIKSDLILDGGNVVIAINKQGKRMAIMTEKVFYENDVTKRDEVATELRNLFGCDIIFLPWDIKDVCGHTDGIVHPISKGQLLINVRLYEDYIANEMRKRLSEDFNIIELPLSEYHDLSWAYINMLQTKDFIAVPSMKKTVTDREAFNFICSLYPQYHNRIIQIDTRYISEKYGGALNCMSWTYEPLILP